MGQGRGRRPAARAHAGEVPRRRLRRRSRARRRGRAAPGRDHVLALPPRGRRHRTAQRGAGARQRHRPDPRRRRRVPRARGQRARAVRGLLRDDEPPSDRRGPAGDLRRAPDPAGRRLPPEAAHRPPRRCARRCHRPQRRRAHPGRLQRRLLRARAARPHDGRRAGRRSRPRVPPRPRDDAYDAGPRAGARDLPTGRRRVPRPGALPQQLAARLLRPAQRRPRRQRHDRQRRRQRRRRRQADLHLPPGPGALLPRRGTDPQERGHLAARRRRPPRGGDGPPRRAGREAGRRFRRQGHRDRSARHARRARRAAREGGRGPALVDRAAGDPAEHRPDVRQRRDAAAARGPASVRRQRRSSGLGAPRRADPGRPRRGRADRELLARRRVQGHLGARRSRPARRTPRAGTGGGPLRAAGRRPAPRVVLLPARPAAATTAVRVGGRGASARERLS